MVTPYPPTKVKANNEDLTVENAELEKLSALDRIAWAWDRFGEGLIVSTSFGLQSAVMLHLVRQVSDRIPVVFVDTGYLFKETYEYAKTLREKIGFSEKTYSASMSPAYQEALYGKLWEKGKEGMLKYNFINKKDLGFNMNGDRETESHIHAGRVISHWFINKLFKFSEFNNVIEQFSYFTTCKAEN